MASLTEEEFKETFRGSPVKRTKWRGLVRNACVAVGNSGLRQNDPHYAEICARVMKLANSADTVIAEHAQWALDRLEGQTKIPRAPGTQVVPPHAQG